MKIKDLLSAVTEYSSLKIPLEKSLLDVNQVVADSRQIQKGDIFVAIRGIQHDGHQQLPEVINRGAVAVVVEKTDLIPTHFSGITLLVNDSRQALNQLAARYYGDPSLRLYMLGVTGTNGKTSITYLIEYLLNSFQYPTGVIGTINHHLGEKTWEAAQTTPNPLELQGRLKEMRDLGARAVAMEVSSHALDQKRIDGVYFNTAIFTNLSHDHLDYHKNMKDYFSSKQRLFADLMWSHIKLPQFAVVNIDDRWGRQLKIPHYCGLWTYGQFHDADFKFKILKQDYSSIHFELSTGLNPWKVKLPMVGEHNVYNAVAAIAAVSTLAIPVSETIQRLESFTGVPGRMQKVENSKGIHVFVDYAHTPDALEKVLVSLQKIRNQEQLKSKIFTVFGCGGNRDTHKRPLMGQIAETYSDQVFVTSDNPRSEAPEKIIAEIVKSMKRPRSIVNRHEAIAEAIKQAEPGDVVLIAGKGHESYQQIGDVKFDFDDKKVAQGVFNATV